MEKDTKGANDWELIVVTSGEKNASTGEKVCYKFTGTDASGTTRSTEYIRMNAAGLNNLYQKGCVDSWSFPMDIFDNNATLQSVDIKLEGSDSWFCHQIYISNVFSGKIYKMESTGEWLDQDESFSRKLVTFGEATAQVSTTTNTLDLAIQTADEHNAGTNDAVHIKFIDKNGIASSTFHLNKIGDDWERGTTFSDKIALIGPLSIIRNILLFKEGGNAWKPIHVKVDHVTSLGESEMPTVKTSNSTWLNGSENGRMNLVELATQDSE